MCNRSCSCPHTPNPEFPAAFFFFHRFVQILTCSDTIHDYADIVGVIKIGVEGRMDGRHISLNTY